MVNYRHQSYWFQLRNSFNICRLMKHDNCLLSCVFPWENSCTNTKILFFSLFTFEKMFVARYALMFEKNIGAKYILRRCLALRIFWCFEKMFGRFLEKQWKDLFNPHRPSQGTLPSNITTCSLPKIETYTYQVHKINTYTGCPKKKYTNRKKS